MVALPPPILSFPFHPFRPHAQQDAGQRQKTFIICRIKILPYSTLTVQQVQKLETLSHDLNVEHVIVFCENCKRVGQQKQPKSIFRVCFGAATLTAHVVLDMLSGNCSSRLTLSDMFKRTAQ